MIRALRVTCASLVLFATAHGQGTGSIVWDPTVAEKKPGP